MNKLTTQIKLLISTLMITSIFATSANAMTVEYVKLDVPSHINTSFKTYMDYRTITNKNSDQYKWINTWGWHDWDGFMRANGEADLGITDNYYMIALGSFYGTKIGTKYRITISGLPF